MISTIPAMNAAAAFANGTRVYYWGTMGDIRYGAVQSTSHSGGIQLVVVKEEGENGRTLSLPAASVYRVN